MSAQKPFLDTLRRIYEEGGKNFLEVAPWPEVPGFVVLRTVGQENEDHYGRLELSMTPEFARMLAGALEHAANEADRDKP